MEFVGLLVIIVALIGIIIFLAIKYGASKELVKQEEKDKDEYGKMESIHSAHVSMSADERADWLHAHKKD